MLSCISASCLFPSIVTSCNIPKSNEKRKENNFCSLNSLNTIQMNIKQDCIKMSSNWPCCLQKSSGVRDQCIALCRLRHCLLESFCHIRWKPSQATRAGAIALTILNLLPSHSISFFCPQFLPMQNLGRFSKFLKAWSTKLSDWGAAQPGAAIQKWRSSPSFQAMLFT